MSIFLSYLLIVLCLSFNFKDKLQPPFLEKFIFQFPRQAFVCRGLKIHHRLLNGWCSGRIGLISGIGWFVWIIVVVFGLFYQV